MSTHNSDQSIRFEYIGVEQTLNSVRLTELVEAIARNGFFVVPNVLSPTEVQIYREKVLNVMERQTADFGKDFLLERGENGIARSLIEYDMEFTNLIEHKFVNDVLSKTVGSTSILHLMNGICLAANEKHSQRRWHRDFAKDFISSRVLSINIFFLLDHFTPENGATEFVLGSHKHENIPSDKFLENNKVYLTGTAGSVVIFDSMLWHRAGENKTDKLRVAINSQFTRPFIKQQIDYPSILSNKISNDSVVAQRLGFWSVAPKGVSEFRVKDLAMRTYRANQG